MMLPLLSPLLTWCHLFVHPLSVTVFRIFGSSSIGRVSHEVPPPHVILITIIITTTTTSPVSPVGSEETRGYTTGKLLIEIVVPLGNSICL